MSSLRPVSRTEQLKMEITTCSKQAFIGCITAGFLSTRAFNSTPNIASQYNIFVLMKKKDGQTDRDMSNKCIICNAN